MSDSDFLSVAHDFQLGMLDTERPHPATTGLADWTRNDLPRAVQALSEVDRGALESLAGKWESLKPLAESIRETRARGNRIFLAGCGATGRLSLSLETFARREIAAGSRHRTIVGFMAGGDAALIRSIERFEDHPDYGVRQLRELGFADGDLLIASTEGGETPFVIGATEEAAERAGPRPFFLYCNPDDLLRAHVARSARVIANPDIAKINLSIGPMALTGSTRMQASTVLMAAIGLALDHDNEPDEIAPAGLAWISWLTRGIDWNEIIPFVEAESAVYEEGEFVIYEPGPYGMTVLTDTTERSPTFTLAPFEREGFPGDPPCLNYLWIRGAATAAAAWQRLLHRDPRALEWGDLRHLTGGEALARFDFSDRGKTRREQRTARPNRLFRIDRTGTGIRWRFRNLETVFPVPPGIGFLAENLALKCLLNAHSTLVMGRRGRYEDNLMTHVSANNHKLIDRAVRYVRMLLHRHYGRDVSYQTAAETLLRIRPTLGPDEPVVLKTVLALANPRIGETAPSGGPG